jgi:4-amino-4-deoxy-L-arabinose transferase-like glycosyltransferase
MQAIFNISAIIVIIVLTIKIFYSSIPESFDESWKRRILFILISAIILKLTIMGIWYLKVGHSFYIQEGSTKDSGLYDWAGQVLASYFKQGIFFRPEFYRAYGQTLGVHYYNGFIYALFGHYHIMVSIFNTLAAVILALLMFHIGLSLFQDKKVAYYCLLFNLFYPHYISQSYYVLKDILLLFLTVLFCWLVVRVSKNRNRLLDYLWLLMIAGWLYFMRSPMAITLLVIAGLHLVVGTGFKERRRLKTLLLLLICLGAILSLGKLQPEGRSGFERIEDFTTESYRRIATPHYLIGAKGPKEILFRSIKNLPSALKDFIQGIILIYWGPTYFYQRSGANLFYAYGKFVFWENLGAIMRLFLMPMVIFGFFYSLRRKTTEAFLFYGFTVIWTFALIYTGSVERWAMDVMPFTLMFGAVGTVNFQRIKPFYILYILLLNICLAGNITLHHELVVAKPLVMLTFLGILWGFLKYKYLQSK